MEAKERIEQLTSILNDANYRYYVLDDPTMQDYEYDKMLRELETLENKYPMYAKQDSPTQRVGGEALTKFEKVSNSLPSIAN